MPPGAQLPVALDAMGGDRAPAEIVAGARAALDEFGVDVVLVGPPDLVGDTLGLPLVACTEVIAMDEDPAQAVRRKKDSSIVRAAELVRDGKASAAVSAGNTGAVMAAALLRMGRLKGVVRPCIATPLPRPGTVPVLLCDAGANAECTSEMLVQFAQMASAHATSRYGVATPLVGLLSIGEEPTKGTPLVKETHAKLADPKSGVNFYGNVEGRDLIESPVDVIVTDGFTGNVALKTLEGALKFMFATLTKVISTDDATRAAGDVLLAHLLPVAGDLDPDTHGGAILLGVDGVSVISHGSSSARAIKNAVQVAHDLAAGGVVDALRAAIHHS
ncbi:MAG TPA: phosphate acyltransferase PlsX [Acidimicrobiales bacterium]|nr:phosphate acyltransferase PlsX [Acidimicrobiales bacterium]